MALFCTCGSNNWETVEHRWVFAARGLKALNCLFIHPTFCVFCRRKAVVCEFFFSVAKLINTNTNIFKTRLDKFWSDQDCKYLWKANLSGTGNRSEVLCNYDDP